MGMSLACIILILSKSDSLHRYRYLAQLEMSLIVSSICLGHLELSFDEASYFYEVVR